MLGSASNLIGLKAILDDADFQRGIANYSKSIANADKQTKGVAGRIGSAMSQAGAAVQGLGRVALAGFGLVTAGATAAAGALTALIVPATLSAARVQEMDAVLHLIGERAGWTADEIRDNTNAIKDLGIRTDVAQGLMTQFARYQLDAADATKLARVAQDAAVISMQDSSEALDGLLHGILTQNTRVLRTYGINLNVAKSMDMYAESIGKTTDELTEAERIQAVMNGVFEQGEKIAGAYTTAMEEPGKQLRSLSRHFYEASIAIGQHFLPAMSDVIMGITGGIKGVRGLLEEGEPLARVFSALGRIAHAILPNIFDMEGGLDGLARVAENVADFLEPLADAIEALFQGFEDGRDVAVNVADFVWRIGEMFGLSGRELVHFHELTKDVVRAFQDLFDGLRSGEDPIGDIANFVWTLAGAFGASEEQAEKFFNIVRSVGDAISEFVTPIIDWVKNTFELKDVLGAIGIAIMSVVLPALWGLIAPLLPIVAAFVGLVAVVRLFRAIWEDDWMGIKTFIMDAWTNTIMPALQNLWQWLQEFIPIAIERLSTFWTETLLPAIQNFIGWVAEVLIPALGNLWSWLAENVPLAIEALAGFWENTLKPAIETVWTFITESLIPTLGDVWAWLAENVPQAIETAKQFWENTLLPAIQNVWGWIQENLLPLFSSIWDWLSTTIPSAIDTVSSVWENTFKPALETVWSFISDNIIPIFETVVGWLADNIPAAIETGLEFWSDLVDKFTEVWEFLDQYVFPIFEEIAGIIGELLRIAVEGMVTLWEDKLQPILEVVWGWLAENVLPILQEVGDYIRDTLGGIFGTFVDEKLDGMSTGLETVKDWLEKVLGWLGKLKDFLANFSWGGLDEAMPGSLPPLALGIKLVVEWGRELTAWVVSFADAVKNIQFPKGEGGLAGLLGLGGELSTIGGGFFSKYKKEVIDPLEKQAEDQANAREDMEDRLAEINREIQEGFEEGRWESIFGIDDALLRERARLQQDLILLEEQHLKNAEKLEEAKKKQYEWEKAQADLAFLQDQMELLEFIEEHGLQASELLDGFEFGVNASLPDLVSIMTAAMQAVVDSANEVLETGSPSKVFRRLGQLLPTSLGAGILDKQGYAIDAVRDMTSRVSTQPISTINNRTLNVAFQNQVSSNLDIAYLQAVVRQTIREEFAV